MIQQWKHLKHVTCGSYLWVSSHAHFTQFHSNASSPCVLHVARGAQAALNAGKLALTRWEGAATF